ncbi:MAG: response regulator [Desulfobacteraceae bacterium]|nr:response regulator [Desulfobacteraceae bacterium]
MIYQKKILIIDDEISIRESLTSFFEDEEFIVFSAEDGESGLDIFFNEKIDIVLTDLRMPKKDGIEVMKAIHKHKPETPMIVVSGAGKKEDIIKALRMGAKDYITKPIEDLDMISHTVNQVLENKRLTDENKQYRKQLEESEHQYRTITENIAEGVFTVDSNENFKYANQAFCKMTGYSNDQVLKSNLKDITDKDSFKVVQDQTQIRKNGQAGRYEIQMINKMEQVVHIELACSPIFEEANQYQGAIAVVRDITKSIALKKKYQKFFDKKDTESKDVVPICASCKRIRLKTQDWIKIEEYFTDSMFSHGICPTCCEKLYPEFEFSNLDKKDTKN